MSQHEEDGRSNPNRDKSGSAASHADIFCKPNKASGKEVIEYWSLPKMAEISFSKEEMER